MILIVNILLLLFYNLYLRLQSHGKPFGAVLTKKRLKHLTALAAQAEFNYNADMLRQNAPFSPFLTMSRIMFLPPD